MVLRRASDWTRWKRPHHSRSRLVADPVLKRRDALTGLPERTAFRGELDRRLAGLAGGGDNTAVVMIDLARFKCVNDIHGHQAGDALLVALADRFKALLHPDEFVARMGGDEFAALIPFADDIALDDAVGRLRCAVDMPFTFDAYAAICGAGIGVAKAPADGTDAPTLLARSDLAMYRAKRSEPAGTCYYEAALDEAQRLRRDLGMHVRAAINSDQLSIELRPEFASADGSITAYAARPRWNHPTLGEIPFTTLASLAEESASILPFGSWLLREACLAAMPCDVAVQVAVSISPLLAGDGRLVDLIAEALDTTGLPPKRLRIEITESMVLRDRERALQRLHAVRRLGVTIGLENVGAGPCSLDVLRSFPFDQIRLHPTILEPEPASPTGPFMLSVIVGAAKRLNIPVIAEGVNALSSYHLARRSGCNSMQGSLEDLPRLLTVPDDFTDMALRA